MFTEFYPLGSNITGMCSRTARQDSERLGNHGKLQNVFMWIWIAAPDDFEAANTDNEIPRTFFANH
jgi:hypothetical protein